MDDTHTLLTINAGSSSVRLAAFAGGQAPGTPLASIRLERGEQAPDDLLRQFLARVPVATHWTVAHRIVHGGTRLTAPCVLDSAVAREIERLAPLAPLHNPAALAWLASSQRVLGDSVQHVAVFDTGFYARLPAVARTYAVPHEWSERYGIRRFGFHGLAHEALWRRWCALRPDLVDGGRVISFQLGAGCSVTALDRGEVRDTSMGFSPLEGLVMATRGGDLDAGILTYLQREAGLAASAVERALSQASGLLGVSGMSGDVRVLLDSAAPRARLAIDLYCYRARKYLGAYLAALGGADGVLFGGGVGEHQPSLRAAILAGMNWAGIELDVTANAACNGCDACISAAGSPVEVRVMVVDEAQVMAQAALAVVRATGGGGT